MSALLYNANGDQVVTGAGFSWPTTAGTAVATFFPTDATQRQALFRAGGADNQVQFSAHQAGDPFFANRQGATTASAEAAAANFAAYALNNWLILFFSWDTTNSWLYLGNISTGVAPAEPSSYSIRTTIVSPTAGTGALYVGNSDISNLRWLRGRIARASMYGRVLSDTERRVLFEGGIIGGATLDHWFGYNGTTDVPDYSGNGWTGTITSLTVDAGPPIANPWAKVLGEEDGPYAVAAAVGGQPTRKRHGGVPGMRLGGATFGGSWAA